MKDYDFIITYTDKCPYKAGDIIESGVSSAPNVITCFPGTAKVVLATQRGSTHSVVVKLKDPDES